MSLQELTTTAPARATTEPKPDKRKRLSPKIRDACQLIADGEVATVKAAAERVGITRQHLSTMLGRPDVQAFIARESARTIASASLRASRRFVELIDAESEHVAAKVSDRILTNAGVLKAEAGSQVAVNVGVSVGYVLDIREPAVTGRDRSDEAKPLIEHAVASDRSDGTP